ncbi:MAG: lipoprotein signal peptidase [Saprospiraceae bacterium]
MKKSHWIILIIISILIIDQISKIYIKTHFGYGEGFKIFGFNWARIYFVENEGMAYGITLGGEHGKLLLSLFRIIMVIILGFVLYKFINRGEKFSLLLSFALILAGALGNIIDSAFYGMIFSETPEFHGYISHLVPFGEGYAGFLHGRVVDMLYFPMINTYLPEWIPIWGGERFVFFQPVFNIADSSISIGVVTLLLFNRSFFKSESTKEKKEPEITSEVG